MDKPKAVLRLAAHYADKRALALARTALVSAVSAAKTLISTPVLIIFSTGLALSPYLTGRAETYGVIASLCALLAVVAHHPQGAFVTPRILRYVTIAVLALAIGALLGVQHIDRQVAMVLPNALDKQKVTATIELDRLLSAEQRRSLWRARLVAVDCSSLSQCQQWQAWLDKAHSPSIRFAWYGEAQLAVGDAWQLKLTLRRPRGFVNPKGFDYAAWLIQQGFVASAYSGDMGAKRLAQNAAPNSWVSEFNQVLADRLARTLVAGSPSAVFFEGLLLGRRDKVSADNWLVLQRTGTNHLFAISGLHIGLVALLGFGVVRYLLRVSPLRVPWSVTRHLPVLGAIVLASTYAVVSGLSLPTQRALIVVVLAASASLMSVQLSLWRLWTWALLIVLVSQPMASTSSGFWLSFSAVALLLWFFAGRSRHASSIMARGLALIKAQWVLAIGLALPLWWLGLPVSLTGPWVNLIAVPLVSIVIVPGLLLWVALQLTPFADQWLLLLASLFDACWQALSAVGQWDASLMLPIEQGPWQVAVAVLWGLSVVALLAPRALQLRWGASCLLVILAVANFQRLHNDTGFKVVVLDVGQGLAVVLTRGHHAIVFDTGMAFSAEFNAGSHIIAPYLVSHGLSLEALIVSHGDLDHKGGAAALQARFTPQQVFAEDSVALGFPAVACSEQAPWQWHGVRLQFLWPESGSIDTTNIDTTAPYNDNNRSCVLLVEFGNTRFLLPGDIEAAAEAKLLAQGLTKVDVLVAPHHGSKTSSSQAFLAALQPAHIAVSAGYKSRYGHPHADVLERFEQVGAQVWATASHGAVSFYSDGDNIEVIGERERWARRWFVQ